MYVIQPNAARKCDWAERLPLTARSDVTLHRYGWLKGTQLADAHAH